MKTLYRCVLIPFVLLSFFNPVKAQNDTCDQWPAECPLTNTEEYYSAAIRKGNGLSDAEIAMQDKMKSITDDMMKTASKNLHWPMGILDEAVNLNSSQSAGTPEGLKSPRGFGIVYQFIANKDSLNAWRNWFIDFDKRYKAAGSDYYQNQNNVQNSPEYKRLQDSAMHYNKLISDMLTAKGFKNTEAENKKIDELGKKQNLYMDKASALANTGNLENYDEEKVNNGNQFKNATIIQVFFDFNAHIGYLDNVDHTQKEMKNYPLQGAKISKLIHFSPRNLAGTLWDFPSWDDNTVILLGNWATNPDNPKDYEAGYIQKKGQDDEHTLKIIKSDKVQNISIHITGNKTNMAKMAGQLNIDELNSVMIK